MAKTQLRHTQTRHTRSYSYPNLPTFTHTPKRLLTAIALIIAMMFAAGCSGIGQPSQTTGASQEKMAPSLTALFDQYLAKKNLSAFERDVLERARKTGRISAQDYETAHSKEVTCMAQNGYTEHLRKLSNGLYQRLTVDPIPTSNSQVDKFMATSSTCSQGVSKVIEALYTVQQGNPGLLSDSYETAVACLRKAKLVDASYTAKRLQSALNGDSSAGAFPFDTHSDAAQSCFAGAGLAVAIN